MKQSGSGKPTSKPKLDADRVIYYGKNTTMINRIRGERDPATNGKSPSSAAVDEANGVAEAVTEQATHLQKHAERLITSHPLAALTVAVAAGLVIGWWVKIK